MASIGSGTHAFARHRLIYEWNIAFQSIPSNNSTVTCKVFLQSVDQYGAMYAPAVNQGYVTLNGERKNFTATSDLSANQKKLLFAANWVVGHNADGTKDFKVTCSYNVNVTFAGVYYGTTVWEGFGTLNTIPRTSSISIHPSTIKFGEKTRIHINRASGRFTHTLTFKFSSSNNTFASKINYVDYDFTPSIDLSRYIPNGTSGWGTIICDTYSGGTKIGSSSARLTINTVNDSRFQPVIHGFTISEGNPSVTTSVGAVYVQSKSKLKVATNASSKMYSTISKIETKVGNATYTGSSIVSGFVAESGNLNIVVTVTDSRGYKATSSKTINLAPYRNPTTTISALRRKDAQEIVDITWSGTSKAISVDNVMGYKIEYQPINKSWILLEQNSSATQEHWGGKIVKDAIDIDKVYNIRITMYDEFMSTVSTTVIPVAQVPMSWGTTGASVGKVFEEGKENFQVSGTSAIDYLKVLKGFEQPVHRVAIKFPYCENGSYVNRVGNFCWIDGAFNASYVKPAGALLSGGAYATETIPYGYRPPWTVDVAGFLRTARNGDKVFRLQLLSDGRMSDMFLFNGGFKNTEDAMLMTGAMWYTRDPLPQ
ncbi:saf-pilin pilus formation protein [Lactococcus phage LW81]|uniref:Saf-pilin pilus formation protein n=1 Tax=Lactococcus phage LW81 TaxID=1965482 RepID=A0A1W6JN90_9CAUD|nr:tail protein [Lactococcus phage LW81]ARM67719.1 saf-pilin pilus formation protein [Lactococcus phage LW81]